jgi:leucyl-tRNA---protein transferase
VARTASFKFPPSPCEYLPDRQSQLHYELTPQLQPADYMRRLEAGWRRFGPVVFRPECPACCKCLSLRVPVSTFHPSKNQRRAWKRNEGQVEVRIGPPSSTAERLELLAGFHEHGHRTKGWPSPAKAESALDSYLLNPFPTEEWSYWIGRKLVGVGYVDALPEGLSAIYFFHDPAEQRRSLGTFNILKMIDAAQQRNIPHVYLGYYVEGCRSLEYKARFRPNEILTDRRWQPFSELPRATAR